MDHDSFQILGFAGSLRRASFNRGLIRAAKDLAPRGVSVGSYEQLEKIPFFNRDVEDEGDPTPVGEFKEKICESDAVLIATSEYDYAIPGVLSTPSTGPYAF
jgi:chromate reductase